MIEYIEKEALIEAIQAVEPVHIFSPRPFMADNGPTLDEVIEAFPVMKPFLETTQGGAKHE